MKTLAKEHLLKKREDQDPFHLAREGFFFFKQGTCQSNNSKANFHGGREEEKWSSSTFGANLFLLSACHHMTFMLETETNTLSKYFRYLILAQISLTGETTKVKEGGKQHHIFINDIKNFKILSSSVRTYLQYIAH